MDVVGEVFGIIGKIKAFWNLGIEGLRNSGNDWGAIVIFNTEGLTFWKSLIK